eukprot:TRINITY_DN6019_c0_g1_i1.p1 TRINITY_DN6019_c0_g1~~TRINITY_DN6019_c0_g1_i1.p1  ORF type:complete len:336 (-),score=55.59 TRINITY_DN6019_c0_g1_i1:50-1015(-)
MCGPINCFLLKPQLWQKMKTDPSLRLWAIIWAPLVIFWLVYFSFSIAKLADSGKGTYFQLELKNTVPIELPAWTICSLSNNETIKNITCTIAGYKDQSSIPFTNVNNHCYIFNNNSLSPKPTADYTTKPPTGRISCLIELSNVHQGLSKVWVHDPKQTSESISTLQSNLDSTPSGICSAVIPNETHTTIHWKKVLYTFEGHEPVIGYDRINYNQDQAVSWDPETVTSFLTIWPGDYFVWHYREETFWTGYDLWYFLGLLGGASFLMLLIHQCVWFPLKRILYGDESGVTFGSDNTFGGDGGDGLDGGHSGVGSSGPRYSNL